MYDIDMTAKPYNDLRVRQALKYLYDRKKAVQIIVLGHGTVSADSIIPASDPFYPKDLKPWPYDPEKGKALLKQAGYADGFKDAIWTTTAYPYLDEGAAFMKEQFSQANVDLQINSVSNDRYLKAFLNETIVMDYALRQHPVLAFDLFVASTGGANTARLKEAKVDRWISELKATTNPAKQRELSGEIIRRYATFAAEIIPFQFDVPWPYKKRVKGIRPDPMSNIDFRRVSLG
jgi:peptide/nickel transport system substrate-binding protein